MIFPLDYHRWKYNDQSDRNMTKSDGNIKRKDCNRCKCSPLSLFIVGLMFLRSIVRNAVSLFGWSEQIQNKSSPDRVSEGVIAGVKVCYILLLEFSFPFVRPSVSSSPFFTCILRTCIMCNSIIHTCIRVKDQGPQMYASYIRASGVYPSGSVMADQES